MSCMTGAKLPIFWSLPGCRFKSENYSLQTLLERPEHILMSSLRMRSHLNKQDHPGSFCLRVWSGLCLRPSGGCMGGVVRWAEGNDDADWHHANITSVAAWCETFPTIKEIRILRLPLRCCSRQIVSFARVLCTVRLQRVCWLEQLGSSIPASRLPDAHASTASVSAVIAAKADWRQDCWNCTFNNGWRYQRKRPSDWALVRNGTLSFLLSRHVSLNGYHGNASSFGWGSAQQELVPRVCQPCSTSVPRADISQCQL